MTKLGILGEPTRLSDKSPMKNVKITKFFDLYRRTEYWWWVGDRLLMMMIGWVGGLVIGWGGKLVIDC